MRKSPGNHEKIESIVRRGGTSGGGTVTWERSLVSRAVDDGELEEDMTGIPTATVDDSAFEAKALPRAWKPVIDGKVQMADLDVVGIDWQQLRDSSNWEEEMQQQQQNSSSNASGVQHEQHSQRQSQRTSTSNASQVKKDDETTNDSDSEFRRVPEMPENKTGKAGASSSSGSRKRSGTSPDKEGKRLKRLLRNRVSAQQARERKKAYLIELEHKAKDLELRNAELEEKNATLQRENYMLRQIVKNTTMANKASVSGQ